MGNPRNPEAREHSEHAAIARRVLFAWFIPAVLLAAAACGGSSRDYLIVVDTSGSMAKDKLLEQVKGGVRRLLDETVRTGDTVALYTFDEELQSKGSFEIGDADSRGRLMKSVEALAPLPKNTDMVMLVLRLRDASRAAEKRGREQVVVILTDGEDAPDPRARSRPRLDIGRFRSEQRFPVQEKYIYYVALRNQKNAKVLEGLEHGVGGRTVSVLVKPGKDGVPGADGAVEAVGRIGGDLREREIVKIVLAYWPYAAAAAGLALLVWLIMALMGRYRRANQPEGYLLYYEEGIQAPMKATLRLDRIRSNRFAIGARSGADFRVRGLGSGEVVTFSSKKEKDRCRLKPSGGSAPHVQSLAQKEAGFYQFGDRFKIGNFVFEYSETQE